MFNMFEIKYHNGNVIIRKDEISFSIEKGIDGDIWFCSANGSVELPISFYSINEEEWKSYIVFENLMKLIVGRYILSGDDKDEYNFLPNDFIDLERKIITWHSDSERDNVLQLKFQEKEKEIVIGIVRDKNTCDRNFDNSIKVRIRTSGSDYDRYYQEFEKFYKGLSSLAYQTELSKNNMIKYETQKEKNSVLKKKIGKKKI